MKRRMLALSLCLIAFRAGAQDVTPQLRDPFADPFAAPSQRSPTNANRLSTNLRRSRTVRAGTRVEVRQLEAPLVSSAKPYAIDAGKGELVNPAGAPGDIISSGWAKLAAPR